MSKITKAPEELSNIEIVEAIVQEHFQAEGKSPFLSFKEVKENEDTLSVDLDDNFEKEIREIFKDKTSEVLGEYVGDMIRKITENLTPEELEELKNVDTTDTDTDTEVNETA